MHGSLSSDFALHGGHVEVSCYPGYTLSADRILVCSSGSWSGYVGACVVEEGNDYIFVRKCVHQCMINSVHFIYGLKRNDSIFWYHELMILYHLWLKSVAGRIHKGWGMDISPGQNEPQDESSIILECATNKSTDQPAYTRSLIRIFASHVNILCLLNF